MKTAEEIIHDSIVEKLGPNAPTTEIAKQEKIYTQLLLKGEAPKDVLNIDEKTMNSLYGYAYQLYNTGNYAKALNVFSLLHITSPKQFGYLLGVAMCYHMLKDYENAIENYFWCVPLDPSNPLPFYHISDCQIKLNYPANAALSLQVAATQAAKDPKYDWLVDRAIGQIKKIQSEIVPQKK